jgi:hypothetical protein
MANDAFQAGFGARANKGKKTDGGSDSAQPKAGSHGGIPGLIGGAIKNQQAKKNAAKPVTQAGGMPQMPAGISAGSFKKGGRIRKTGLALLHKGEHVIPAGKHSSKKTSHGKTVIKA